jgi:putative protease
MNAHAQSPPVSDFETRVGHPPGLFVLVRSLEQAEAALAAGADGIYLDFLELTGTSRPSTVSMALLSIASFWGVAVPCMLR